MKKATDILIFKFFSRAFLGMVFLSFGLYIYAQLTGDGLVLPWSIKPIYFPKPLFIEYFQMAGESIGFYIDQYVNWQRYETINLRFVNWSGWLLLTVLVLLFWTLLTAVTYFSRFIYFVSVGLLILLALQLNLEELQLWGVYSTYVLLGIIIIGTYFFHTVKPNSSLGLRVLVFGVLLTLFTACVALFGKASYPASTLIQFGLFTPIALSIIFMIFVAGQNIFSVIKLTTLRNSNGKQSLFHFITFGLIYNILMILLFLSRRGKIDFELVFIDPQILLVISAVSAFYSFELRFEKYQGILPIKVLKNWIYPLFFVLTLTLFAYAELNANDALVDGLEYLILITHLALGAAYFIAAFINFTPLILKKLEVWKVFFKPNTTPMFLINLASLLFIVAIAFYINLYPYYQLRAGIYNAQGDISALKEQHLLAEQYYRQGVLMDFVNFKSNIQVAHYESEKENAVETIEHIQNTFFKKASGKGYTRLSNYYNSKNQLFNTLFILKEANQRINSKEVINNLAFTYYQFQYYDSAYITLNRNWVENSDLPSQANLLALSTELSSPTEVDSLLSLISYDDIGATINGLALANLNQTKLDLTIEKEPDTLLLQNELFLLINHGLNHLVEPDSAKIDLIDYYLSSPYNAELKPSLDQIKAIQLYQMGLINKAFQLVEELKILDGRNVGHYNYMLGIWALHQNQIELANSYFNSASNQGFPPSEIQKVQDIVKSGEIPSYENRLTSSLKNDIVLTTDSLKINLILEKLAGLNAFDETTVLDCIKKLKLRDYPIERLYNLLLESHNLNTYSVPIFQAYVLSAVDNGLSRFALEGLSELSTMMPPKAYQNFARYVNQQIEVRRNQFLE